MSGSEQTAFPPVGQLLLARLLVAGEKGATGAEIKKALEPLVGHRWAGAALTEQLRQTLADFEAAGLAVLVRKGKTERGTLTTEGRRRALEVIGLDQLPPKTTWDKVKKTYLAARALGLTTPPTGPAATRFGGEPGFKAVLLKTQFVLPLGDYPAIQEALDALAWTLLGLEPGPKFTVKAVQAALILRELGHLGKLGPKPDPGKEVAKLLAREVGARQSGKDELRLAAIRRWVDGDLATAPLAPLEAPVPPPSVPENEEGTIALDLPAFARRVVEAARSSPTGRFGADKVFVGHVWSGLRDQPAFAAMGPDEFKRRLAEANNARLLDLSRADMVEAMDPEDVRLSEVPYLGATFHFIRI
ncbi:hypothetical protein SAMN05444166_3175 [Singulisphaera sp. GP187]|uniref:hypothetical protein n=1 Tax=Singulisphaera sp. GP187 TaxID=1882752 RepID=UPI000927AE40|nr:hypothetical protein [Singulisphaera sp. GP187]SIO23849.1 hypothetical protein SAMN05444166_3175 [Singulisphaera sp. GP187]